MLKKIFGGLLFVAAILYTIPGYGDVVRLKNGVVLTGEIIMETADNIVMKMDKYGEGKIRKSVISSIEYTSVPKVNTGVISNSAAQEPKKSENPVTNTAEKKTEKPEEPQKKNEDYFHIMFGVCAGFSPMISGYSTQTNINALAVDINVKNTTDYDAVYMMNTGFFIDAQFLRLDIGYGFVLYTNTAVTTKTEYSAIIALPLAALTNRNSLSYSYSYLNLSLLLKIPPASKGPISLWPALGIEYDIALTYNINGFNMLDYQDANVNSFWILAGGGMNIKLADHFYIVPTALIGYNLTAPYKDTDTDPLSLTKSFADMKLFTYGLKLNVNLGFAYEL